MSESINDRKLRHLETIRQDAGTDRKMYYFDAVRLAHRALPELDLAAVDPATTFLGKRLSFPLLISSMTGGDHERLRRINANLAAAAEAEQVALGVGSQRVAFTEPEARRSFALREHAPRTVLLANLGAVQLNCGFDLTHARAAAEMLQADALCLHLNPLQEAVQPQGNTHFGGLAQKIGAIQRGLGRPVIVKEVGAGVSAADAALLLGAGIRYVDVAGAGGTSWSRIEHHSLMATERDDLGLTFQDWGIPTPAALRALRPFRDRLTLIASGGLRSGIDMVKGLVLGAELCGLAAPFLEPAMESAARVVEVIRRLKREFVTAMFLLGVATTRDLVGNERLLAQEAPPLTRDEPA